MAYGIMRSSPAKRAIWLTLAILPFFTSFLVRVYAWMGILSPGGVLSQLLLVLGVTKQPISFLNTPLATLLGIVYSYLPFTVFPLYVSLEKIDPVLLEAASDLGCRPTSAFWRITFPLSLPGVFAGASLVFVPSMGEYVIPELLGGPTSLTIGRVLWHEFFSNHDWPVACAIAVMTIGLLLLPMALVDRLQHTLEER